MTQANALFKNLTVSGGSIVNTYSRAGAVLTTAGIKEAVIFRTGALLANTPKTINLAQIGYAFQILAIAPINSSTVTNIELITITNDSPEALIALNLFSKLIECPFMVLSPEQKLNVKTNANCDGLIFYCEQRAILESQTLTFE